MSGIKLAELSELNQAFMPETEEDFQNFCAKYDKPNGVFKLGFIAKRVNALPGEPIFYPVWLATLSPVTVARQMLGEGVLQILRQVPGVVWWMRIDTLDSASDVISYRVPKKVGAA